VKVNVAVCGRFHYHNYVRFLACAGILNRFYYSHRVARDVRRLGIAADQAVNCWPKEYLIRLHGILTGGWLIAQLAPVYGALWQLGVLRKWASCDLLHVMLHGTGLKLIQRARSDGAKIIVEPVNQHPEKVNQLLGEEADRFGLRPIQSFRRIQQLQIEEASSSDFLLAPSHAVRDSFVERGYEPGRTGVLPYGVDLQRFHPLPNGIGLNLPFRVICVGQVSLRKGQLYLLEAWNRLRLPRAELLLIGATSYEMKAALRRYHGTYTYIPFVPNDELWRYYGSSSLLVLPSVEDGFSYVVGEAMASGLPVITTVNNGAAEIVCEGKDGFVVPIRSSDAIAERLDLLYRNKELLREMSQAALAKAHAELSWSKYAIRLCRFYASVFQREASNAALGQTLGSRTVK
jgi:glycosyltransferase involved in cell wall biosynthesis